MRTGIIARAEQRGLGIQSFEACEHLGPERVLLVEPVPSRCLAHRHDYSNYEVTRVTWDGHDLDERATRRWLDGLDVVYTAETPYDWRLPWWAAETGCAVVVHVNPEQLDRRSAATPHVTWWAPTTWRLDQLPDGTTVVPMPVAIERFAPAPRGGPVTFVHVAGLSATGDRNGTATLAAAVRHLEADCTIVAYSQDGTLPRLKARYPGVRVVTKPHGTARYWELYETGDVLVLPRRYGGLSLPAGEAAAAGMAILMTDCPPNDTWPGPRVAVAERRTIHLRCGRVHVADADPDELRVTIEKLAADRAAVDQLQAEALTWAARNSWAALLPTWHAHLEHACEHR